MAVESVFRGQKTPWKNPLLWTVVALATAFAIWFFWPFNGTDKPVEEVIISDPQVVTIQKLTEKVALLEKSNGEINASLDTAIVGINLLSEEMEKCCQCKKPLVKKVVKKQVRKPVVKTPAPVPSVQQHVTPPAPRYVPPVYNKPIIQNPETGKMVPTMPLGVQPVMTCNNQTVGGVKCAN